MQVQPELQAAEVITLVPSRALFAPFENVLGLMFTSAATFVLGLVSKAAEVLTSRALACPATF
jgi:hypothetical protein